MIDVRKLRMLAELDQRGTIAAVAEEMHLTPPGVSMQIAALEKQVGVALTERQGRGLVLTPAGKVLAAHGRDLLDRLSLAELELDSLRAGAAGEYVIAAFPSAARTLVADVCRDLIDESSAVSIRISTPEPEDALKDLSAGRADIAIIHSYSNVPRTIPEGIHTSHVADETVRIAVPEHHGPSVSRLIDLATMNTQNWITAPNEFTCFSMVERACGLAGFRPRVVAQSVDFSAQLELVAAGLGVALIPFLTVERIPDGVALVEMAQPVARSIFVATRRTSTQDAGIAQLTDRLAAAARSRIPQ
jgi:DNA-binding transcriptional LysR family regulator